jgi:hypothetical protein
VNEDWRLTGQERFLQGAHLRWASWWPLREGWDHDHCEFCQVHFRDHVLEDDPETQFEGFVTDDNYRWICRGCFEDFKERFRFRIDDDPSD